jgi:hypothetical protein
MNLSDELVRRIHDAIAQLTPEPVGHINYEGTVHGALPLFGTLGEVWLLRPDGTLWRSDADYGLALEPLPEDLHVIAIVQGVKRYPWLRELLPARPQKALVCPECGGDGQLGPQKAFFCRRCRALGWVEVSAE